MAKKGNVVWTTDKDVTKGVHPSLPLGIIIREHKDDKEGDSAFKVSLDGETSWLKEEYTTLKKAKDEVDKKLPITPATAEE